MRFPACFISDAGGTPHSEHPDLVEARVTLTVVTEEFGDAFGESALLGAHRATDAGTSVHRGILEVVRPLLDDLRRVGRENGLSLILYPPGEASTVSARSGSAAGLMAMEFSLTAQIRENELGTYPSPRAVSAAEAGGTVTLTWTKTPAARWDNPSQYSAVVRKAGSAPTTITDGTSVSTTAVSGATDAPGVGTWYYGVASIYSEGTGTRYGSLIVTSSVVIS